MLPGPAVSGCCFVSFHIMWAILSTSAVLKHNSYSNVNKSLSSTRWTTLYHFIQTPQGLLGARESDLRVGSVPLGVDGGEVPALLHRDLEAAGVEAVQHAELDVAAHVDGAVAAALLGVHRSHRLGAGLKKRQMILDY